MFGDVEARDFFGAQTHARHRGHGFGRVLAGSGFRGEHHGVGTIQHGVGHVHDFRTGRHRVGDHRLHHLGGGNDGTVQLTRTTNQRFLDAHQLRIADFDAKVTAGNHHHIGGEDHVVHGVLIADGFRTLDFGDDFRITAGIARQATGVVQVFAAAREGDGEIVDADFSGGDDIGLVFVGQRFGRQAAAELVDPFVIGQRATNGHFSEDFHPLNFEDFQLHTTIVEQQDIARHDVRRQAFIVDSDFLFIAFALAEVGIEQEFVADVEENFAFFEGRYANFWSLEVAEDGHVTAQFCRNLTHFIGTELMIFRGAVREVHTHYVCARGDNFFQVVIAVSCRA